MASDSEASLAEVYASLCSFFSLPSSPYAFASSDSLGPAAVSIALLQLSQDRPPAHSAPLASDAGPLDFISSRTSSFCSPEQAYRMRHATTYVFFGLPVRGSSLVRAVDAWPSLSRSLPFFDLISLRILRGTLQATKQSDGQSPVEKIPVEVWDTVKDELVRLELQEAHEELMRKMGVMDWSCWGKGVRRRGSLEDRLALPPSWQEICITDLGPCVNCDEKLGDFATKETWSAARFETLQTFLAHFAFCSVSPTPLKDADENYMDLASSTFIAFRPRSSKITTIETDCNIVNGRLPLPEQQRIATLEPDDVAAAASSRQRFSRFLDFFHLEPVLVESLPPPKETDSNSRIWRPSYRRRIVNVRREEAEPRWTVFSICISDD